SSWYIDGPPEGHMSNQIPSSDAKKRASWSLRSQFLLFGLCLVLPNVILAGFLLYEIAGNDRAQLEQRMIQVAGGLAADIDRELQRRIIILQTLATARSLARDDFSAFHE